MTLNWNRTASDYRLMEAIGPDLIRAELSVGRHEFGMSHLNQVLPGLIRKLPDVMFWERTRHRASTAHGRYQIMRAYRDWVHGRYETHKDAPGDYRTLAEPGL